MDSLGNFRYYGKKRITESVSKITGVRGSGETVILAKIEEVNITRKKGWLVF